MSRPIRWMPVLMLATVLSVGGCGGGSPTSAPSASSSAPAATTAPPTEDVPSATPQDTVSSASDTESVLSDDPGEPEPGESTPPPVLGKDASGRDLTTADFFALPEGWRDGRFNVAGKQQLSGIAGPLTNCEDDASDSTTTLELRLANNFGAITMNLGQSDDSSSSDSIMYVKVLGNGKYVDATSVPFNRVQPFRVKVQDVNALKIQVWMGGPKCDYRKSIDAVIMNLRVE
jgi:hypothetical protein